MARAQLDDEGRKRVEDHAGIALTMARARWRKAPWIDMDDLIGTAHLALCRASSRYLPDKGPFTPFAIQVIDWELGKAVNRSYRNKSQSEQFLDDEEYLVPAPEMGEESEATWEAFSRLSDRDKDILSRVAAGGSYVDVGRALGMKKGSACSALRGAKKRFRKLLESTALAPA